MIMIMIMIMMLFTTKRRNSKLKMKLNLSTELLCLVASDSCFHNFRAIAAKDLSS